MRKAKDVAIGGALAIKSTDILLHARNPGALSGDISGMVGIGIAGAMADLPFKMMEKKKKKKRR